MSPRDDGGGESVSSPDACRRSSRQGRLCRLVRRILLIPSWGAQVPIPKRSEDPATDIPHQIDGASIRGWSDHTDLHAGSPSNAAGLLGHLRCFLSALAPLPTRCRAHTVDTDAHPRVGPRFPTILDRQFGRCCSVPGGCAPKEELLDMRRPIAPVSALAVLSLFLGFQPERHSSWTARPAQRPCA
jgi:hypothetical protein